MNRIHICLFIAFLGYRYSFGQEISAKIFLKDSTIINGEITSINDSTIFLHGHFGNTKVDQVYIKKDYVVMNSAISRMTVVTKTQNDSNSTVETVSEIIGFAIGVWAGVEIANSLLIQERKPDPNNAFSGIGDGMSNGLTRILSGGIGGVCGGLLGTSVANPSIKKEYQFDFNNFAHRDSLKTIFMNTMFTNSMSTEHR